MSIFSKVVIVTSVSCVPVGECPKDYGFLGCDTM
jgi:hypothetical protein